MRPLSNKKIAELLAREAETAKMPAQKALRAAARRAFMWEEEAADIVAKGRSLTELDKIGPCIAQLVKRWIDKPPAVPEVPDVRRQFLTITEARADGGIGHLRNRGFTAAAALIAGIPKDRILNFLSRDKLLEWTSSLRESRSQAA